ncbi:MAG: penicillin-binding transpeptidase domain-containing protein [Actinomycetota bacterium]|nr:penicillin-binding transpeptidase domain-containing protein [Actinomycetota bacterium]
MDRHIRSLALFLLACFVLLFIQLNRIQVLQAPKLGSAAGNPRVAINRLSRARGVIQTANGVIVAQSVPSHDQFKYLRVYPDGPLYAGITGYDSLNYGAAGVEASYGKYLGAHSAPIHSLSDLLTSNTTTDSVTLTISSTLQSLAAQQLGTKHGAVVAIDPSTGAILAMYSSPTYNPNLLASHNGATEQKAWKAYTSNRSQPLLSRAYQQRYPPGSTFKIVTSSAIYDHMPSLANTIYPMLPALKLPQTTALLHNYANEVCGGTLANAFKVSCDSTYGQIGLDLGGSNLASEAKSFGFDHVPPLDLPGAVASSFPAASTFAGQLPALAFSAIGQENVAATPLEMAMTTAAIANGGRMMVPHVVAQVRSAQGTLVKQVTPQLWRQATSSSTAASVAALMRGVTQGGTASNVAIPGVTVAAKTGTAQLGRGNGYTDDWLVAFAPASNPKVAVAVEVNNQPPPATGSSAAGPIARAMLIAALGLANG